MTDSFFDWDDFTQEAPFKNPEKTSVKVELFSRIHHIDGLAREFERIMLMSKVQREKWLDENQRFLQDMLDQFVSESFLALDGVELDEEGIQLSIEFVTKLRDVMNMIQSILFGGKRLKG